MSLVDASVLYQAIGRYEYGYELLGDVIAILIFMRE